MKDVDEAVRIANATEYGLVAAIQTGSMERGLEIAERLNTGTVHVNDQTLNNDAYAPFGGTGASGNGSRFGSQSSWDEFTQWQWVTARPQAHGFRLTCRSHWLTVIRPVHADLRGVGRPATAVTTHRGTMTTLPPVLGQAGPVDG